ncbi:hypothetical protein OF377_02460 [Ureaplasma sp. ES3154-GEN]|uniref:hypothetical protein n=1 Tax=Ureaplasma sp. ES3154-GEN TaxID=2984844 RepID=UPI0021E8C21E|nr:hypothetical protein [Ureaplasma sp. ES3154-GEN]MCV3743726.1 hypothetical protein [Ureaplasma sp. ES3154-GEN]
MSDSFKQAIDAAMFSASEHDYEVIVKKINNLKVAVSAFDAFITPDTPWHVYIAPSQTNKFRDDKLVYNNKEALNTYIEVHNQYGVLKNEK